MFRLTRFPLALALFLTLAGCNRPEGRDPAGNVYATRESSGDIAFEVTPRGMIEGRFVVEFRANTHHGDLAELDLDSIVTLVANGKEVRPAQADRLRGHHAAGKVAFQIDAPPDRFEIVVRGARGMPEQKFQWP